MTQELCGVCWKQKLDKKGYSNTMAGLCLVGIFAVIYLGISLAAM